MAAHESTGDNGYTVALERIEQHQSPPVRWYTPKERRGVIARLGNAHNCSDDGQTVRYEVFGTELFKKETDMKVFIGTKVATEAEYW